MEILYASLVLLGVGVLMGVLLTVANNVFAVKENENYASIRECLPGANCGACGYSGCDAYAKAIAEGRTENVSLCIPGGQKAAEEISAILGIEADEVEDRVAFVNCNGKADAVERKYIYDGLLSCRTANMAYSGDKSCIYACLGYGDCIRVCPNGAISIKDGVAKVDPKLCIGCKMCLRTCPNKVIMLINRDEKVGVACSNRDKGALTKSYCKNGCIACGKCARVCPTEAITVTENLAKINYFKCIKCGKCEESCPTGAIHKTADGYTVE